MALCHRNLSGGGKNSAYVEHLMPRPTLPALIVDGAADSSTPPDLDRRAFLVPESSATFYLHGGPRGPVVQLTVDGLEGMLEQQRQPQARGQNGQVWLLNVAGFEVCVKRSGSETLSAENACAVVHAKLRVERVLQERRHGQPDSVSFVFPLWLSSSRAAPRTFDPDDPCTDPEKPPPGAPGTFGRHTAFVGGAPHSAQHTRGFLFVRSGGSLFSFYHPVRDHGKVAKLSRSLADTGVFRPETLRPALHHMFKVLSDSGVHHLDLGPHNVLVQRIANGFRLAVIDWDRVSVRRGAEKEVRPCTPIPDVLSTVHANLDLCVQSFEMQLLGQGAACAPTAPGKGMHGKAPSRPRRPGTLGVPPGAPGAATRSIAPRLFEMQLGQGATCAPTAPGKGMRGKAPSTRRQPGTLRALQTLAPPQGATTRPIASIASTRAAPAASRAATGEGRMQRTALRMPAAPLRTLAPPQGPGSRPTPTASSSRTQPARRRRAAPGRSRTQSPVGRSLQ